jgi:hypothetical protein
MASGVPGSIRCGYKKNAPLGLMLTVRRANGCELGWPATRRTESESAIRARVYARRSPERTGARADLGAVSGTADSFRWCS